ncbi:putative short-chain dehydrogenase [Colletotrichum sojae]|uniref:Putative short-chain dehydrogenase n=1 Tax=Colletotrichum sojae TaxID=2175907 RepID=A0A8H6MTE3_9PEZI|nr:putative short-chain dehydrogenase [Colletotrichum sojae]
MGTTYSMLSPPPPSFVEDDLPTQEGRVFIVTGGYSGIGYELSRMIWRRGGVVYIAGRDPEKARQAISAIEKEEPTGESGAGMLRFLQVSLDDLDSVRKAAKRFLAQEERLDVLFNNAGVSNTPAGWVSPQGHEVQLTTNCLGPYLLTKLLAPLLVSTARRAGEDGVGMTRVTFTTSIATHVDAPRGGMNTGHLVATPRDRQANYTLSKTGNWFLADHFAKELGPRGVVCVALNPGNVKTPLLRHVNRAVEALSAPLLHHARFGAYTNLWAGFSPDVKVEDGGRWVEPWGRFHPKPRPDIVDAMKTKEEGGTGQAAAFMQHCEKVTFEYR